MPSTERLPHHEVLSTPTKRDLVLADFMTHMRIRATACGAFFLGYRPAIVASAIANRDLSRPDGFAVSLKAANTTVITDLFAVVVLAATDLTD